MTRASPWIDAAHACRLLGVSRNTLYAYVSRGFVHSQPSPRSPRERTYARPDVERLLQRTEQRRAPDRAAARALNWGMPVLESSMTLIDGRRLYYRGHDATLLARSRSLEEVAALLWTGSFAMTRPPGTVVASPRPDRRLPYVARAEVLLATAAARDRLAVDLRAPGVVRTGLQIVQLLTRAATLREQPLAPADAALARTWKLAAGPAAIVRAALVLCADHELNVSSFTARCVASSGSHPYAVVLAGLAALEGPKHGGAGARVESMLESMRRARQLRAVVEARLRRGELLEGFGHPLYPDGDPRARALLEMLGETAARSAEYRFTMDFAREATAITGDHPNLDYALASVGRVLDLPRGAPLMLFAIGRSVGWVGHAIEQYATGQLIRPRAKYAGQPPSAGDAPR